MARYANEGVRCSLYCATDGDAGRTSGILVSSPAELGVLRRQELRDACATLGIASVEFGGHPDGRLSRAEPAVVVGQIVGFLRRERPDVVITFGPEGAPTQHSDHRAICALATSAFLLAGTESAYPEQRDDGLRPHRPARLCYVTWPHPAAGDLYPTIGQPTHIPVDVRQWNPAKRAAYAAHRSQQQHRANFDRHAIADDECYFVMTGPPAPRSARDLFAGI